MQNIFGYNFVLVLVLIMAAVIQTNSNAINICKSGGDECFSDDQCCSGSCRMSEDGTRGNCLSNLDEIKCSVRGVDCTLRNVTCCNHCWPNWSGVFCT